MVHYHASSRISVVVSIVVVAVTAIGFALPQQALAYRHHHSNVIKVDQQISQANVSAGVNEEVGESPTLSKKAQNQREHQQYVRTMRTIQQIYTADLDSEQKSFSLLFY